jgi:hypothetical protein
MDTTLIIKIESGVVADVYSTDPAKIIVVDYDLIDGDESCEGRRNKAVLSMTPDNYFKSEDADEMVSTLLKRSRRGGKHDMPSQIPG